MHPLCIWALNPTYVLHCTNALVFHPTTLRQSPPYMLAPLPDRFITFADFCFLCLLSFAMCRRALRVMRPTIVGYLVAGAVLSTFDADR